MKNKLFGFLYAVNIISQAIFTLLTPAALAFGVAWLFVSRVGAPSWLYAVLIPLGVIAGFISMIKFVLSATAALERLEKQNRKGKDKNE